MPFMGLVVFWALHEFGAFASAHRKWPNDQFIAQFLAHFGRAMARRPPSAPCWCSFLHLKTRFAVTPEARATPANRWVIEGCRTGALEAVLDNSEQPSSMGV